MMRKMGMAVAVLISLAGCGTSPVAPTAQMPAQGMHAHDTSTTFSGKVLATATSDGVVVLMVQQTKGLLKKRRCFIVTKSTKIDTLNDKRAMGRPLWTSNVSIETVKPIHDELKSLADVMDNWDAALAKGNVVKKVTILADD